MKILQKRFTKQDGWQIIKGDKLAPETYNFVMAFGSTDLLNELSVYKSIQNSFPKAVILINSTAGEILDTQVTDNSISLTAIYFEKTKIKTAVININETEGSFDAGKKLALRFDPIGLKNVLVISDGQKVNGTELVEGLQKNLPEETIITGGLAGDGSRFEKTLVGLNEKPMEGRIAAIGFYGENLFVTSGTMGGWDSFGPERLITKSKTNILYEMDGKPALDIYKMYLGEYANELPGSGLLFPLSLRIDNSRNSIVRTILGINEEEKSLTFAGNMQEGKYVRLMKANLDRLIEGSSTAAQISLNKSNLSPQFALLISCVGRKLVLGQRIEEEVEAVREVYGSNTNLTGFYSYGEISHCTHSQKCDLHNQTMTITTFSEY